jgi:DNA primase catalytic subunit
MIRVHSPYLTSEIESYYRLHRIDLSVLSAVNFRHFRFRLEDGSFYKVKRKIRDSESLQRYLARKAPIDVYYSTACWLNPHLLGSRIQKDVLKNIMISCDLVFDIDQGAAKIRNLEDARRQAIALNEFLESKGIKVRYSAFSGNKGFHVICDDPWKNEILEQDSKKREAEAIEKRKKIIEETHKAGITFDEKVTRDPRRIIRLPGTINSKTGLACIPLSKMQLESKIRKIIKLAETYIAVTPRIPHRHAGDDMAFHACKIPGFMGRLGVRPKPEQGPCYSTFITNNIPHTTLKIPVLEFGCWKKIEQVISIIEKVQSQYHLGDVFLFSDGKKFTAFSVKAVTRRRVEKILLASGSLNYNVSKKYGCTYTRVGKSIDLNGKIARREPTLVKVIESDLLGQASRPHCEFLKSMGVKFGEQEMTLCGSGKEELELLHAVIE